MIALMRVFMKLLLAGLLVSGIMKIKKATYVYQTNPLKGIFLNLFTDFD